LVEPQTKKMRAGFRGILFLMLFATGCGGGRDADLPAVPPSAPVSATDKAQALAQVLAAYDAHGGVAGFGQLQRCRLKSEIIVFGEAGPRRFVWEDVFEAPGTLRRRVLAPETGELLRESLLTDAGHWGREPGGEVSELPPASAESLLPAGVGMLRVLRQAQLPGAELRPAPTIGPTAVSVLLPGEPDTTFDFDPQSRLIERVWRSDGAGSNANAPDPQALELELSEIREWAGLKIPTKVTARRNGRELFELTLLEYEPLERVEAGVFRALE
jgi:hypothetical protein